MLERLSLALDLGDYQTRKVRRGRGGGSLVAIEGERETKEVNRSGYVKFNCNASIFGFAGATSKESPETTLPMNELS